MDARRDRGLIKDSNATLKKVYLSCSSVSSESSRISLLLYYSFTFLIVDLAQIQLLPVYSTLSSPVPLSLTALESPGPVPSSTVPALQELHLEQKGLFDTIDDLHSLHIGRIVDLPQIIVAGNQSSEKSSVLSALSHVPFPTSSAVCTRFPMELALRTDQETRIEVSIIPEDVKKKKLPTRSNKDETPQAIEEAKKEIGINENTREIYNHVLRIEIFAPNVPNLTLVDLPGLYTDESLRQSREGGRVAFQLAERYMSQKRSIILAVVSANTNVEMDGAIVLAKKNVDPSLSRVLGVVTQADRIENDHTATQLYLQLAKGEDKMLILKLGWHVLRNLSEEEARLGCSDDDRDRKESEFLSNSAWREYSAEHKGIDNFRKKLNRLLLEHISLSIPGVISDIEEAIANRTAALEQLGPSPVDVLDTRDYLHDVTSFERTPEQAVQGSYLNRDFFQIPTQQTDHPDSGSLDVRKLRALVRELNRAFTAVMHTKRTQILYSMG